MIYVRAFLRYMLIVSIFSVITWPEIAVSQQQAALSPPEIGYETTGENDDLNTCGLSWEQIDSGWIALFDGESLFGWKAESKANWRVEQGEIRVDNGERGLLRTTSQFDDFHLKLKFKAPAGTNSGIFIRTSPKPTSPGKEGDCYEVNIAMPEQSKFTTGSLVNRQPLDDDAAVVRLDNQWHTAKIQAVGNKIDVWVDDVLTVSYEDQKSLGRGFIGLQLNSGAVAFKDIYLKPESMKPLFNGKDLAGWKTDLKLESRFDVTDAGELQILSGSGQIESQTSFGDFIFSTKCKTNSDGLNSGVFFRCIEGEKMNGYESQIQNQFKDDDPTKPVDCGTGGIFRRTVARRVNAADQQWFSKTIIATGPHIAVWVNGLQVTDWSDQRAPHANPRKGLRKEPGTFIFQGHDPTTDILLKDILARELSQRNR